MVLQKGYAITRAMFEVCEDAVNDGVRYLEVRFSPILHTREGMSLSQVMDAICEGVAMAEYRLPIHVRIIVCGMRQLSARVTEDLANIAWRYRQKGVVAFDLAGPEHGFSSKLHKSAFKIIRDQLLNCTLHSGEAAGWESIHDSLRYCGAHRIGHGVRLVENESLLNFVVDRRISIESCVTSNIQTKAIDKLENHPIRRFFDAGVLVVPCTDNPTVSGVTLSGEYLLIQEKFGFTVPEVVKLIDHGFQAAFVESSFRERMRAEALYEIVRVLNAHNYETSAITEHFESTGVPFNNVTKHLTKEPILTLEDIRRIPKADTHVRLDGSVSLGAMWGEFKNSKIDLQALGAPTVNTFDDFMKVMQPAQHTPESEELAKVITAQLLQTPDQIYRGMADIFRIAHDDNVIYLEIYVRPPAHTDGGMTMDGVIESVVAAREKLVKEYPNIACGIGVCVLAGRDSPLVFNQCAKIAIANRQRGVICFGVFGSDEISAHDMLFFQDTFRYLKAESMNVAMSAGRRDTASIVSALHEGGAGRIVGGYTAHKNPELMNFLASHKVPVEVNVGGKLNKLTPEISAFQHFVRLLLDMDVPAVVSSFRRSLYSQGRCESLLTLVDAAGLSPPEVLRVMGNSFRFSFQGHNEREMLHQKFNEESCKYLTSRGFTSFSEKRYFPK
jgi:adenosine deaminase